MKRVVVTRRVPEQLVAEELGAYEVVQGEGETGFGREELAGQVATASALVTWGLTKVDGDLLAHAPNLKVVANISAGTDNLDLDSLTARGIWATNVPDAFTAPTAEVAIGLMLSVMRRLNEGDRYIRSGSWQNSRPGQFDGASLRGKRLGLVGFGRIARATAARATAFGLSIDYFARHRAPLDVEAGLGARYVGLDELLQTSDIVSLHVAYSPETHHLIGRAALEAMKPTAFLINTARGRVVDEAALTLALEVGRLAGAGLDVFEGEPHVTPRLLELPGVVVTPHLGGASTEARREAQLQALRNVRLVLQDQPPESPVNQPRPLANQ